VSVQPEMVMAIAAAARIAMTATEMAFMIE
jgi:hypothetical protein